MLEYIQSRSISACNCIKTFDLSTLYKAILHYKLKGRLKELVQSCLIKNNGQRRKHTFARKGQISVCKKTLWFVFRSPPWLVWPLWNMCVAYEYWYVPSVVNTSRSFPHVWLITRFVTRLIPRVLLVEQEQPTWVHPQILVLVTLIFSFMGIFCRLLFILYSLSFGHCVVCLLRYTDYLFGILKLFGIRKKYINRRMSLVMHINKRYMS
jgi:hypothetical protein